MFSFVDLLKTKNRPLVMGILNITPDSFSDGGDAFSVKEAVRKFEKLCQDGADIIDIGACSTAPMNTLASQEEEVRRLKTFLPEIMRVKPASVPVSIDTFRSEVVRVALDFGVDIINDESGTFNTATADLVSGCGAGWIFMHTGGATSKDSLCYIDGVVKDVEAFFTDMKHKAIDYGLNEESLCYDVGIGFGKSRQDDIQLLCASDLTSKFPPLLVGVSRKRVIGEITGVQNSAQRVAGSVAAATLCAYNGADILRVHDVKQTLEAVKVSEAFKRGCIYG